MARMNEYASGTKPVSSYERLAVVGRIMCLCFGMFGGCSE